MIYKYPSKIFSHEHSLYLVHPLNTITPIATTSSDIKKLDFILINLKNSMAQRKEKFLKYKT